MAEILFKRGLHESLPKTAVDGAFYLTTDSHRLYAGIGTELVDLNQYIKVVNNSNDLNAYATTAREGDFYFVKTGNMLLIRQGGAWVQVNSFTDTTNASLTFTGKDKALTITLVDSNNKPVSDTINFIGTQGTDVSVDADGNITVQGCTYSLAGVETKGAENEITNYAINLNPSSSSVNTSTINLKPGKNIAFSTGANNTLTIGTVDANDIKLVDIDVANTDATGHSGKGSLQLSITETSEKVHTDTAKNVLYYKYGENGDLTAYNQETLNVYSKDEVDKIFKDLNPMKYLGTVNTLGALTNKTGVKIGDTYMASAGFDIKTITGSAETQMCKAGDLFIATGTENANGTLDSVTWTYVPSGDDSQTDTQYVATVDATNNTVTIRSTLDNKLLTSFNINSADTKIEVTSVATKGDKKNQNSDTLAFKVKHAEVTVNETTDAESDAFSVSYIDSLTIDSTGHVTGYNKKTSAFGTYVLSGAKLTKEADNKITATINLADTTGQHASSAAFTIDASANDNLNATMDGSTIKLAMEWGTF